MNDLKLQANCTGDTSIIPYTSHTSIDTNGAKIVFVDLRHVKIIKKNPSTTKGENIDLLV
jgi:hypothetical protein